MKMMLSMPSTISRAPSVSNAIHTFGSISQSIDTLPASRSRESSYCYECPLLPAEQPAIFAGCAGRASQRPALELIADSPVTH